MVYVCSLLGSSKINPEELRAEDLAQPSNVLLRGHDRRESALNKPASAAQGKYNSADNCYFFVTNKQLNRQLVQWAICLAVCKMINSSFDTQTHSDLVHNCSCSHFGAQMSECIIHSNNSHESYIYNILNHKTYININSHSSLQQILSHL